MRGHGMCRHDLFVSDFGQWLRDLRMRLELSRRSVAKTLGVDPSFIAEVEEGSKALPDRHVQKIARMYLVDETTIRANKTKKVRKAKTVRCLNCDQEFQSEFNKVCDVCKTDEVFRFAEAYGGSID